ncbi:Succinate dehydrogenase assembly factor 2 mitochondrial [Dimargaris verticillata]|uniref:Succinate dehydrogenase assembly factor 2, mitochondrial n=1 Tax=Dimargaris verticillata TaxID=2761393 RepID=A0A9W8B7H5_9FUNG|nr:Succinate dehydrogenase assembly factor 2 mitochondrial [Dimargaris verticillata]
MATPNLKPSETVEQQRKRLIYQSRKRGILENDLLLSNFLQHQAKLLSPAELNEIDTLLNDITDWDLYYYLTDKQPVPADIQNLAVWPKLKATVREKRDGVLMMPPLN